MANFYRVLQCTGLVTEPGQTKKVEDQKYDQNSLSGFRWFV